MAKAKKKTQQAAALKRKTNSLKARIAAAEVRPRGAPPAPPLEHTSVLWYFVTWIREGARPAY